LSQIPFGRSWSLEGQPGGIKVLAAFAAQFLEQGQEVEPELANLLERYLTYLLEYGLRTPGFLKAVS